MWKIENRCRFSGVCTLYDVCLGVIKSVITSVMIRSVIMSTKATNLGGVTVHTDNQTPVISSIPESQDGRTRHYDLWLSSRGSCNLQGSGSG